MTIIFLKKLWIPFSRESCVITPPNRVQGWSYKGVKSERKKIFLVFIYLVKHD